MDALTKAQKKFRALSPERKRQFFDSIAYLLSDEFERDLYDDNPDYWDAVLRANGCALENTTRDDRVKMLRDLPDDYVSPDD